MFMIYKSQLSEYKWNEPYITCHRTWCFHIQLSGRTSTHLNGKLTTSTKVRQTIIKF